MPPTKKLPQLVSIRGVAAWWVVIFHFHHLLPANDHPFVTALIAKGYLAVDLFFILSGFIIFINYAEKIAKGSASDVIAFYWNRISRVYPVHFFMLGAYLLLFGAFFFFASRGEPPPSYTFSAFLESLALVQAFTGHALTWNVPSWSISAECGAYLVFPIFASLFQRYLNGVYKYLAVAGLLLVAVAFFFVTLGVPSLGGSVERMAPLRTAFEFLLGMVLGSAYLHDRQTLARWKFVFLAIAAVSITIYAYAGVADYFIFPAVFTLLLAYLCCADDVAQKFASNKGLVFLGEISYSTYMVHYFVYDVFKAVWLKPGKSIEPLQLALCLAATLFISIVMYRWIEVPAQRALRSKFSLDSLPAKIT